jgi:hypothetical protein
MGIGERLFIAAGTTALGVLLGPVFLPFKTLGLASGAFNGSIKAWQVGGALGLAGGSLIPDGSSREEAQGPEWQDTPCFWCGEGTRIDRTVHPRGRGQIDFCHGCVQKLIQGQLPWESHVLPVYAEVKKARKGLWRQCGELNNHPFVHLLTYLHNKVGPEWQTYERLVITEAQKKLPKALRAA